MDVLVIDDSELIRCTMRDFLLKSGFRKVFCANDGIEGLRLFEKNKPQIVIVDAIMPNMDGYIAHSIMRNMDEGKKCVFIMITGSDKPEFFDKAFAMGFDDCFSKPINKMVFLSKIKRMLREKLENDIEIIESDEIERATRLQVSSLPKVIDNEYLTVRHLYSPFEKVSGDFFEYWWDSKSKVLKGYVLDVAGHGLASAMQVFTIKMLFSQGSNLKGNVMEYVNAEMFKNNQHDSMVAAIAFEVDLKEEVLRFIPAGISPFHIKSGCDELPVKTAGHPLGYKRDATYKEHVIGIENVYEIIFGSDGYFDLINKLLQIDERHDDVSAVMINLKRKSV